MRAMNPIQDKLLSIAGLEDIEKLRRVDLVARVGCGYPSQITHHLKQLMKRGDLVRKNGRLVPALKSFEGLFRIPVMGEADCGEATKFADGRIVDYLAVSQSLLKIDKTDSIYALLARGDSMNHATVAGKEIENDDYIIVQRKDAYEPRDSDIVVSDIGGLANVKRFRRDQGRIILVSDSYRQQDFAPIVISEHDDYNILGQVIDVVKAVG